MIVSRFLFSRKIPAAATFEFCNTIGHRATFLDVRVTSAFLISPDMIHSWHLLYRRVAAGSFAAARSCAECWGEDAAS